MAAVLVHIDLDGDQPHASSLAALAAGRLVASSWGATLYAALIVHDPRAPAPPSARVNADLPALADARARLARAGADKLVVALTDRPIVPLWSAVGGAWQAVLDHLRPRLVLFGADAPAAAELGARTGARIGARLLLRARPIGDLKTLDGAGLPRGGSGAEGRRGSIDGAGLPRGGSGAEGRRGSIELRDRDGVYARAHDGGAAVVMIGAAPALPDALDAHGHDPIEVIALAVPGGADDRVELVSSTAAELAHAHGPVIALGDDVATNARAVADAKRLAAALGGTLVGGREAARAGAIDAAASLERGTALAPELCVQIGATALDLAGASCVVRIGGPQPDAAAPSHADAVRAAKRIDSVLPGTPAEALAELVARLEIP